MSYVDAVRSLEPDCLAFLRSMMKQKTDGALIARRPGGPRWIKLLGQLASVVPIPTKADEIVSLDAVEDILTNALRMIENLSNKSKAVTESERATQQAPSTSAEPNAASDPATHAADMDVDPPQPSSSSSEPLATNSTAHSEPDRNVDDNKASTSDSTVSSDGADTKGKSPVKIEANPDDLADNLHRNGIKTRDFASSWPPSKSPSPAPPSPPSPAHASTSTTGYPFVFDSTEAPSLGSASTMTYARAPAPAHFQRPVAMYQNGVGVSGAPAPAPPGFAAYRAALYYPGTNIPMYPFPPAVLQQQGGSRGPAQFMYYRPMPAPAQPPQRPAAAFQPGYNAHTAGTSSSAGASTSTSTVPVSNPAPVSNPVPVTNPAPTSRDGLPPYRPPRPLRAEATIRYFDQHLWNGRYEEFNDAKRECRNAPNIPVVHPEHATALYYERFTPARQVYYDALHEAQQQREAASGAPATSSRYQPRPPLQQVQPTGPSARPSAGPSTSIPSPPITPKRPRDDTDEEEEYTDKGKGKQKAKKVRFQPPTDEEEEEVYTNKGNGNGNGKKKAKKVRFQPSTDETPGRAEQSTVAAVASTSPVPASVSAEPAPAASSSSTTASQPAADDGPTLRRSPRNKRTRDDVEAQDKGKERAKPEARPVKRPRSRK